MTARARMLRWAWIGVAPLPLLAVAVVVGAGIGSAVVPRPVTAPMPPATPPALGVAAVGRPAQIRAGSCADGGAGPVVQTLPNLVAPDGHATGQERALPAERSFGAVPLPLDALLAVDHVVTVDRSAAASDRPIACGAIDGVVGADGALTVGLREADDSGFRGVTHLSSASGGGSTLVSVFLARG